MEVSEHGVAAPATYDPNFNGVNATEEQRHGSAGPKGSSGYIIRIDASMVRDCEGSGA